MSCEILTNNISSQAFSCHLTISPPSPPLWMSMERVDNFFCRGVSAMYICSPGSSCVGMMCYTLSSPQAMSLRALHFAAIEASRSLAVLLAPPVLLSSTPENPCSSGCPVVLRVEFSVELPTPTYVFSPPVCERRWDPLDFYVISALRLNK